VETPVKEEHEASIRRVQRSRRKALYITTQENKQVIEIEFSDGTTFGIDVRPAVQFRADFANVSSGDRVVQRKYQKLLAVAS